MNSFSWVINDDCFATVMSCPCLLCLFFSLFTIQCSHQQVIGRGSPCGLARRVDMEIHVCLYRPATRHILWSVIISSRVYVN
ncbi:hypothetical protein BDP55DRAFT_681304 [Colletotrichum godetiae]|uniref:Uncharacterized protein n=1 Tax=Colletotrichum godetiae TaxID=1209918 RepID=A0AAJ0EMQ5_9PEZI|nr:uncharacterized protein BDP55DRAFT_681304 [Colletotrichum godetiae]KAK1658935.1 hypothetical protein BDP55DRAFT_681304 [Colletotrichum godetiae]